MRKNFARATASVFFCASFAVCHGAAAIEQNAKDLFFEQANSPSDNSNVGLVYSIERHRPGHRPVLVDNGTTFASGDRIKLHLKTNFTGYAYIYMTHGSSGNRALLYPPSGEDNFIQKGKEYVIPSTGFLTFDDTPGTEKLKLMLSKRKMPGKPDFDESSTLAIAPTYSNSNGPDFSLSRDLFFEGNGPTGHKCLATYCVQRHPNKVLALSISLAHDTAPGTDATIDGPPPIGHDGPPPFRISDAPPD